MKFLSVNDLIQSRNKRAQKRKECFDKIVQECCLKIKKSANLNKALCIFDVPEFVIGYPLYDLNECISYVIEALTKNGFEVRYLHPNFLIISWFIAAPQQPKIPVATSPLTLMHQAQIQQQLQGKQQRNPTYMVPPQQMQNISINHNQTGSDISNILGGNMNTALLEHIPYVQDPTTIINDDAFSKPEQKGKGQQRATSPNRRGRGGRAPGRGFGKSIAEYKPSGKFVLDLS